MRELVSFVTFLRFQEIPDTLVSPLPGGVSAVVRALFGLPQWFQIGGIVVAAIVFFGLVGWAAVRRRELWGWLRTRSNPTLWVMGVGVALIVIVTTAFGFRAKNYIEHENSFCLGCHVMDPAFARFETSEHSLFQCHDCHQQPLSASLRQVYLWVAERPSEIGEHAPVPNRVCETCHIQQDPDTTWQRISATAGHRIHLESDSSALAGVQCVTCHGVEVHRFVPPDQTCGQAGCHRPEDTHIALGAMQEQATLHCTLCHEFTAVVGELTPRPVAQQGLVPRGQQCLLCHEMAQIMVDFVAEDDPHDAVCGTCHNPHTQTAPSDAAASCTNAGCHEAPEELTPFHRGLPAATRTRCLTCHRPHTWRLDGDDCRACHQVLR